MLRTLALATVAALAAALPAHSQDVSGSSRLGLPARGKVVPQKVKALGCDGLRTGVISEPGFAVGFTFEGTLGDVVDLVQVAAVGFEGTFPIATVESPTEGPLGTLNGTTLRTFVLPETGQYRITVTASAAGAVRLGRFCPPPATVPDGFLACGDIVSETLAKAGELDYFVFTGQLNDDVQLSLIETAGFPSSSPRGTLFSPTGVMLATFDANSFVELSLPETGSYTLRVRANNLRGVGSYNVGLNCFPPLNPILLTCGQPPQMLTIDDPGEVFFFSFDGGVDDVIEITLAGSGNAVPTMRVVDPLGSFVGSFNSDSLTGIRLGTTGTYTVEVRASTLADLGPFSIALACRDPLGPATAIACGGNVAGSLTSIGEFEFYTFSGTTGDTAELTLTETAGFPGTSTARMRVFTPSGSNLGAFDANSINPLSLPETGTYTVRVTSNTLVDTGTYSLALTCLPPSGTTHLGDDVNVPGDIALAGETDVFSFDGVVGEVVEIPLVVTSGFGGTICRGTLRAPSSTVVGTFDAPDVGTFTLPESGTFTFEIIAVDLISTGAYRTGCEKRTNPGGGPDEDPESPSSVCGQVIIESLDVAGEIDYFRFDGTAGHLLDIGLVQTSGFTTGVHPQMTIFAPSGAEELPATDATTLQSLALSETGEYLIRVNSSHLFYTGTYNLSFGCRDPLGPIVQDLVCGDLIAEGITPRGELDYYTFHGTQGDIVEIPFVQTAGFTTGVSPQMTIWAPSGAVELPATNATILQTLTLTETGQYTIRVNSSHLFYTGTYNIGFECRSPLGPVVQNLVCGDLAIDGISQRGEVDYYTFTGSQDDIIEIPFVQTGGFTTGVSAQMTIWAPSGAIELPATNATTLQTLTLTETGQYTIRVNSSHLFYTGTYNIGLECRSPLGPIVQNLVCGDLVSEGFSVRGEVDYYTFTGTQDDIVEIPFVQTGGFTTGVSAQMTIWAPSGAVELPATDSTALPTLTLTETGQYTIRVNSSHLFYIGTYNIGFECRNPLGPVVQNLICGDLVTDGISVRGEIDYYTFSGSQDDIVEIPFVQTGGFTTGVSAQMTIWAPSGAVELPATNATTLQTLMLTETGQYTLRVTSSHLFYTGTYNIGFECRSPLGPVVQDLDCGDLISDGISVRGEIDYYTFDGTQNDQVDISFVQTGGFTTGVSPQMTIWAPSGAVELATTNATTLESLTLSETGQYVIRVNSSHLFYTGTYNLGLNCP